VPEPEATESQVLVEVRAVSLNRGECAALRKAEDGWRPGWDLAGIVARGAADGSGPGVGARVMGWVPGGSWAELAAVRGDHVAEIPAELDLETASTLPVAGLTARGLLRLGGDLVGKRVAVTGGAGGVGRFAIQLAAAAGAHVTAVVGRPERGEGLKDLGANEIEVGLGADGEPFDLILESAGGASLVAAMARVAPEGVVATFGNSSDAPATFDPRTFYRKGSPTMRGFFVTHELLTGRIGSHELAEIAGLVAAGGLESRIDRRASWREASSAIGALLGRTVAGKAVLTIDY
ncbi:MAG: zinc-binding dehydrogenase, partial [Actinomycetota bacterium]